MSIDAARAKSLFLAASDLSIGTERSAYLERVCGGDDELRARVEDLLRANDAAPLPPAEAQDASSLHASDRQERTEAFGDPTTSVGSVLSGKFKLVEEIGEGGMGNVYMAQQTEPVKRAVAVKVIKAGMDTKAVLARFEAERQALAMMDHPNIARVLDAGMTDGGRPYFVMELVKGTPITQYCDERKLTPRQRLELFVPVCLAIQHAHQKGIIHRDIKPSNVLVALYDDKPVPKVIDFGVAKAAGLALTDKTLMTGFGAVVGTPEYMSPEQANMNNLDIDTRSDVYSLGVLLYELLTGSTPVDRKSLGKAALMEILRIVREDEAPKPSAKLSTVGTLPSVAANRGTEPAKLSKLMKRELDWVVLKALEKDRSRRYDTATGLARDVQRYLANEAVIARPASTLYRMQKTWQRNKFAFVSGTAIAASLVIGVALSVWQAKRAIVALDELRETAPAFVEQARALAAREQFAEAIEKLDYAAKLRPDEPEYLAFKGDLLQCQFRLADAAKAYRAALKISPGNTRCQASAALCEELLAAPPSDDGKLTRESLSKLSVAMQQQQRPAAELMPVARLLGEEKELIVAYWGERLKGLPITAENPLEKRLTVRDDGLLALDLGGTKIASLALLACAPLAVLNLSGIDEIVDISVLSGMKLNELNISGTKVADLSPLRDMRTLETLKLTSAPVFDLSALRGLQLKKLYLTGCPIRDIAPLRGVPLEELFLGNTRVTDISPLAGMPLKSIDLTRTPVLDFTPLVGLPLEKCTLQYNRLTDLAVLTGMPLRELSIWGCADARNYAVLEEIKSLELLLLPAEYRNLPTDDFVAIGALRNHTKLRQLGSNVMNQMGIAATGSKEVFWREWDRENSFFSNLRKSGFKFSLSQFPDGTYSLDIRNQPFSDLSVVKGAPISDLWLIGCRVTDLAPVQNSPLRVLCLHGNPVEDLRPLRNMPLEELSLDKTTVSDLTPLKGLPLKKLYLHDCEKLTDISTLVEISTLERVTIPIYAKDVDKLHKLPNLKFLGFGMNSDSPFLPMSTADEFWKDRAANSWITRLRDSGLNITTLKQLSDRTWDVSLDLSAIRDLTILSGAPISSLRIGGTAVSDLEPVRGMPLKHLSLWGTQVVDLSPLKGMPIEDLNLHSTKVADISVLRGMPLNYLKLNDCTHLVDLSPLADARELTGLTIPPFAKMFEFLRGFPKLERLSFAEDPGRGWRPNMTSEEFWTEFDANPRLGRLRDSDLKMTTLKQLPDRTWEVNLSGSTIGDLKILSGLPISNLMIGGTSVSDLEPLRGMAIKHLELWNTKVTNLSALKGMKLDCLNLYGTEVTDISDLCNMPLIRLQLSACTELTDLSPLIDIKTLRYLTLPPNVRNIEFLRAFPKLERMSYEDDANNFYLPDKTVAEFWREYDSHKK